MSVRMPEISADLAQLEKKLFQSINEVVEPKLRAGWGAPGLVPAGVVVLETTGRVSGTKRRVPVMAAQLRDYLVVATFRGRRSQWIKNLAATPRLRYWSGGEEHHAKAFVFDGEGEPPKKLCWLKAALAPSIALGWAFALLTPTAAPRTRSPSRPKRATKSKGTAEKVRKTRKRATSRRG